MPRALRTSARPAAISPVRSKSRFCAGGTWAAFSRSREAFFLMAGRRFEVKEESFLPEGGGRRHQKRDLS